MFIELTDTYDGKPFILNINAIRTVRDNGKGTIVCTSNANFVVCESYQEVVEKMYRKEEKK